MIRAKINCLNASVKIGLLIIFCIGAILAGLLMPRIAIDRANPHRIHCISNLKQIGLSMRIFANEHEDKLPWQIGAASERPSEVSQNDPTIYFLAASNLLTAPKIVFCPADVLRTRPNVFAALSRSNISYFIGLEANSTNTLNILSGDRNVTGGSLSNSILTFQTRSNLAGWGKDIHKHAGNIGLADGSAQQLTTSGLNKQLQMMTNETIRLLIP
jgi:hypothetical protein